MQIDPLLAASQVIDNILQNLQKQIKIKLLCKLIPEYNKSYITKYAIQGVQTGYMPQPRYKMSYLYNQMNQDQFPNNIPIDQFANFLIPAQVELKNSNNADLNKQQFIQKQFSRYRRTGSTFRNTSRTKRNKQTSKQLQQKYFILPPNLKNSPEKLLFQQPSQQQQDFELQLRALQKKLYFTRKAKKQQEQKQKQRVQALKRRKSSELPKADFTYELNGNFMPRKPFKSDASLVQQIKASQSFDFKPKQKKSLQQILNQANENRGRSQLNSRYEKANLFNNSNKRQVSHLPFIKMNDNIKIREQNRNSQGNKTERLSLKQFSQSLQQKSFKHYTQLQRQKKQKELIAKLESQRIQNLDKDINKNPQQPEDDGYNNLTRRRQSYLMNKYLKKLKQQAPQQNKKSLNFNRVSFPHNTAIHNYYKHDFNEEKKYYESEVISRVLDNHEVTK